MANVLNEYLTEMNIIINKYRGTLAQVIGDGLYVIFGAPKSTSDKDHALKCVKMAIDMQEKMNDLNKKWFECNLFSLAILCHLFFEILVGILQYGQYVTV